MLDEILREFKKLNGENFKTDNAVCYSYSSDASIYRSMPDGVVRPQNTKNVVDIVKLANKYKTALIPRGGGTGLCGGAVAIDGGIIVDMQYMNKVKKIRPENLYCIVEPGVVYDELNRQLKKYKYTFPGSPGSGEAATIGGMVANNASGMRAVKYGATRDYVLGLEIVLPTGKIMKCGTHTLKNSSGYQIEKLMVGSEGTLGIITEITLKIIPLPKSQITALVTFDDLESAGKTISNIIAHPIIPSSMEIMDSLSIVAVNKGTNAKLPDVEAILIIECDGAIEEVRREMSVVENICRKSGANNITISEDPKVFNKWHQARKSVLPALGRYRPDLKIVSLVDDMAVPISKIAQLIISIKKISQRNNILITTYGHASDGNLHSKVLLDPTNKDDWKRAEITVKQVYDVVLKLDGTVSGEHGIGISKAPYMIKERKNALSTMKAIKKAFDPNNIMNPGKMFEWEKDYIITKLRYPAKVD